MGNDNKGGGTDRRDFLNGAAIAIGASLPDGRAYTDAAIDQGWRAINEIAAILATAK
jgi:hypothetical protein